MKGLVQAFKTAFQQRVLLRFLIVGAGNTAASFCIYAALVVVGLHYTVANLVALIAGIGISYLTNGAIVFRGLSLASFLRYVVMWAVLYGIQIALIWVTVQTLGPDTPFGLPAEIIGGLVAMVIAVPTSFVLQRWVVFRSGGSPGQ